MKAVVAAFNQEKALVGAFSVITNLRMELFGALVDSGRVMNMDAAVERSSDALDADHDADSGDTMAPAAALTTPGADHHEDLQEESLSPAQPQSPIFLLKRLQLAATQHQLHFKYRG